ncbi:hypothetical protein CRENBAI_003260 [Crenichthys baileyi]|uniref:Uncharacterized protein n=1 Tax=Crenichthys baileyi TaxID=28760 RepID=A0AAV9RSX2_9TELE
MLLLICIRGPNIRKGKQNDSPKGWPSRRGIRLALDLFLPVSGGGEVCAVLQGSPTVCFMMDPGWRFMPGDRSPSSPFSPCPPGCTPGPAVKPRPLPRKKPGGRPSLSRGPGEESLTALVILERELLLAGRGLQQVNPLLCLPQHPSRVSAPPPMAVSLAPARGSEATPDTGGGKKRIKGLCAAAEQSTPGLQGAAAAEHPPRTPGGFCWAAEGVHPGPRELLGLRSSPRRKSQECWCCRAAPRQVSQTPCEQSTSGYSLLRLSEGPRGGRLQIPVRDLLIFFGGARHSKKPDNSPSRHSTACTPPYTPHPDIHTRHTTPDTPHPDTGGPDPNRLKPSTRRRGHRKRGASVLRPRGLGDAQPLRTPLGGLGEPTPPPKPPEGLGAPPALRTPLGSLCDASAPAPPLGSRRRLSSCSATEGVFRDASAPAHGALGSRRRAPALAPKSLGSPPTLHFLASRVSVGNWAPFWPLNLRRGVRGGKHRILSWKDLKNSLSSFWPPEPLDEGFEGKAPGARILSREFKGTVCPRSGL